MKKINFIQYKKEAKKDVSVQVKKRIKNVNVLHGQVKTKYVD